MLSCVQLWDPMDCSTPGFPVHYQHPELAHSCSLSQWCHPTISFSVVPFSSCFPSFPSIRVFSNESVLCIRWSKYWSFSFSIHHANEYSGLTSFRIDWLDLLAPQGTLKESSLTPQFSTISLLKLCCLYGPTLTSIHDYWKKHSFGHMDICQQSNVSAF